MGFSRKEYWRGLPCPPPGHLPDPGIKPSSPVSSAFQMNSLLLSRQGSPGQVYRAVTMINSPSFCLSGNICISSCLEGSFPRYIIFCCQISLFRHFKYVIPVPLWLLMRNWALISLKNHLSISHHFCLAAFYILSLALNNLVVVCLSVDLFETTRSFLGFFVMYVPMFHQIWEIFSHYLFKYFFLTLLSSPFVTPLMNMLVHLIVSHMLVHLIVSHRSLKLCSFFFILFSLLLFRLSYFISPPSSLLALIWTFPPSSLIPLPSHIYYWNSLLKFLCQLLCFSVPEF